MVLLHHLGGSTVGQGLLAQGHNLAGYLLGSIGASGVELFFVLSGVVLVRPYVRSGRPFVLQDYVKRRFGRIFPAYFVSWLAAGLSIYVAEAFPTWWTTASLMPPFTFGEWFIQLFIVYFGTATFNFAWWSLTVELLFYACIPVLVRPVAALPAKPWVVGAVLAPCVAFAVLVPALLGGVGGETMQALPSPIALLLQFVPCFAAGLLLARMDLPANLARTLIGLGLVFLLAGAYVPALHPHIGYGLMYTGIVSRTLDADSAPAQVLKRWHFVWLGERSYSLFLIHRPVIVFVSQALSMVIASRGATFLVLSRGASMVLSLFCAMLMFSFVERRFARGLVTGDSFWPVGPMRAPQPLVST